jgi:23S rRNA (guanosine2251-2'-O)-methyltransferase
MSQLEGRNPILECLKRSRRRVYRIWLDQGAKPDVRIRELLDLAQNGGIKVERVPRADLDRRSSGRVHNGVIAEVEPVTSWSMHGLLEAPRVHHPPLFVLADGLSYEHNLGAVLRSCLGFGAEGLVVPTRRGAGLSPVVERVSMGAIEEVPLVREGLYGAIKNLKREGYRVVGADMLGEDASALDLSGPVALVLGGEGSGLSSKLKERCDALVSVPLHGALESLNVSVAAGILMYEKRRQDGWYEASPEP